MNTTNDFEKTICVFLYSENLETLTYVGILKDSVIIDYNEIKNFNRYVNFLLETNEVLVVKHLSNCNTGDMISIIDHSNFMTKIINDKYTLPKVITDYINYNIAKLEVENVKLL